jgi:thiol-disulfide isomerase/thioredoxin
MVLVIACNASKETPASPAPSRVNAVMSRQPAQRLSDWCDIYHDVGAGPNLRLPVVVDAATGKPAVGVPSGSGWIWINLWATWCSPCLREMPTMVKWQGVFRRDGISLRQQFVSVDEEVETLREFMADRRSPPHSAVHIHDPGVFSAWIAALGLKPDTAIPINIFTDENERVRCIRTGEILDGHFPVLKELFSSSPR